MENINGATVILPHPDGDPAPVPHIHPHTDETFYVAAGELTFQIGDRTVAAPAGSLVFVPRGMVHTAWNSGGRPMRGILLLSPGGAEHLFEPVETPLVHRAGSRGPPCPRCDPSSLPRPKACA